MTKRSERPSIAIIGVGKVGTALGALAVRAGYHVTAVAGRNRRRTEEAASRIGAEVPVLSPCEAAGRADLVLLAVPDDAIEASCHELVTARSFARGSLVAHCSGALSSECLAPARQELGCQVASFHPLQSFPTVEAALASLPGSYCFERGRRSPPWRRSKPWALPSAPTACASIPSIRPSTTRRRSWPATT